MIWYALNSIYPKVHLGEFYFSCWFDITLNILWKVLSQWLHWYSFSPECVSKCLVRSLFFEKKTLPQWLHLYNLSIECVFKFHLRLHFIDKALAHLLHWYVFPLLCILKCPISWILFQKHCHIHCIDMVPPQCESTYVS